MKKSIFMTTILVLTLALVSSCKSKQEVVAIPGAHVEATNSNPAPPIVQSQPAVSSQPEEVRDERFSLDKDETNTSIINQNYHVVVGSFKNRDNAKGLQATLNSEGNQAVIVINEHGMYRVLIASYQTYAEARAKINQINSRFPDAWVLIQKK